MHEKLCAFTFNTSECKKLDNGLRWFPTYNQTTVGARLGNVPHRPYGGYRCEVDMRDGITGFGENYKCVGVCVKNILPAWKQSPVTAPTLAPHLWEIPLLASDGDYYLFSVSVVGVRVDGGVTNTTHLLQILNDANRTVTRLTGAGPVPADLTGITWGIVNDQLYIQSTVNPAVWFTNFFNWNTARGTALEPFWKDQWNAAATSYGFSGTEIAHTVGNREYLSAYARVNLYMAFPDRFFYVHWAAGNMEACSDRQLYSIPHSSSITGTNYSTHESSTRLASVHQINFQEDYVTTSMIPGGVKVKPTDMHELAIEFRDILGQPLALWERDIQVHLVLTLQKVE